MYHLLSSLQWSRDVAEVVIVVMAVILEDKAHLEESVDPMVQSGFVRGPDNIGIAGGIIIYLRSAGSPVLNIVRVGRDIDRYLLFCLLPIRYGKIVHHIVCSKKQPIFEISADKLPNIGR